MMRIGIITGFLYPFEKSGPAIVAHNLAKCLVKKNIEVTIFGAIPKKRFTENIKKYYPKVKPKVSIEKNIFSLLPSQLKYLKQIDSEELDIVHFECLPGARGCLLLPFLRKLKDGNLKVIQKIHGWPPIELKFRFNKYFEKFLYKAHWELSKINMRNYSDCIIVNSDFMKKLVKKEFQKNIKIIPNGIDMSIWNPRKGLTLEGNKNIVFWGRFSKEKGVDLIIKSTKNVLKTFPDTHFYLIGKGPLYQYLIKIVKDLGIEKNIHFTGFLPKKELIKYVCSSDIVMFPSRYEPFGMMILEAMALKKPIISTRVGGIKDIIKNYENGILVNPKTEDISKTTIQILKNDGLRDLLSAKAYETAKKYKWEKICNNYIDYYKKLVDKI